MKTVFITLLILVAGPIFTYYCIKFGRRAWINSNKKIEEES